MHQIEVTRFGGPEVLRLTSAAAPTPSSEQVLVEVSVAGVSGLDVAIRRGAGGPFAITPPYVPGLGAAGSVRGVGQDVDPAWIGTRVVTDVDGGGAYAQLLVAPATSLVPIPDDVADQTAAALMHDGRTALTLLEATPVHAGENVLVMPAAGGLGSILVELLARRGAHVIGAARGHHKLAAARALGAEHTVDYTTDRWADALTGIDVVFDGVGGAIGRRAAEIFGAAGRFSSYGLASGEVATLDPAEARARKIAVQDMSQLMVEPDTTANASNRSSLPPLTTRFTRLSAASTPSGTPPCHTKRSRPARSSAKPCCSSTDRPPPPDPAHKGSRSKRGGFW